MRVSTWDLANSALMRDLKEESWHVMLRLVAAGRFRRDVKRAGRCGKDIRKLAAVLWVFVNRLPVPGSFNDHPL